MNQEPTIVQVLKTEEQLKYLSGTQKQACTTKEDAHTTLENLYQTVFENSAVAITITDAQERIISWNKYAEQLLNIQYNDVFLQPVHTLYPEEEWKKIRSQNIRQKGMQHHLETKILRKNKPPLDVDLSISVIKNKDDQITGSIAIIKDISEEKRMKQALQASEQRFKNLYEYAPVPYHTLTPEGIITDVNQKWCEVFGYTKEEVLGKSIFTFIIPEEQQAAQVSFQQKQQSKQLYTEGHERRFKTKNSDERIFVTRDFFIYAPDSTLISVQTTLEDITERKRTEAALNTAHQLLSSLNQELERKVEEQTREVRNLLKQKDDFINQLGHDLKSPLTPIVSLLPLVMSTPNHPKNKERLEVIYRNALYMKNLVNDTLKLARLNSRSIQFTLSPTPLKLLVDDVIREYRMQLEEKRIEYQQIIDYDLVVMADALQLKEMFSNLISNAIKFTGSGGFLKIQAQAQDGDSFVLVSVTDTGIGLTDEQKKCLFQEFYKADSSRHDISSSGLGLSICKRIIERHGGKIWVESSGLGKGATFYCTIPAQKTKRNS
ncbi:MAG: PAS domain-containing sensor histidine kinase [Candidatus Thermoplasmatota archaeon]